MRCPKCGAGLTGTRNPNRWWCKYCGLDITLAQANSKSLDQFIKEEDRP